MYLSANLVFMVIRVALGSLECECPGCGSVGRVHRTPTVILLMVGQSVRGRALLAVWGRETVLKGRCLQSLHGEQTQ